jgi:hypothetical protein
LAGDGKAAQFFQLTVNAQTDSDYLAARLNVDIAGLAQHRESKNLVS